MRQKKISFWEDLYGKKKNPGVRGQKIEFRIQKFKIVQFVLSLWFHRLTISRPGAVTAGSPERAEGPK
jgi:hypothetical protein